MSRGVFITFEGGEGCGKSTQVKRLAARLESLNLPCLVTREPGGTVIGETIRDLLQFNRDAATMTGETELLLFEASRAQLVREVVRPALQRGAVVISDRFFDSTTVYQGAARKLDRVLVEEINRFAVGDCVPDLTFVLDMEVAVAQERMNKTPRPFDRMEQQPPAFHERVRVGYRELAERESNRVVLIRADENPDAIEKQIWDMVTSRLPQIRNPQSATRDR